MHRLRLRIAVIHMLIALRAAAQLSAVDDIESYTSSPIGQIGGTGDWISLWGVNSQNGGGVFLSADSRIDGAKAIGLFGNGSTAGQSISRAFSPCASAMSFRVSMRADYNIAGTNTPANLRRMAFTVRVGNDESHFSNQRLSFFFAAGSTQFQWFDGTNRATNAVTFVTNHIYDLAIDVDPSARAYSFVVSNRTSGASFAYAGAWTLGSNGESLGSVACMMRGPSGPGNDAFFDSIYVESPTYVAPPLQALPIREGDLWRYWKGSSTPPLQGTNQWYRPEFDDIGWLGPAPSGFGYGDCDDGTVLTDMQNAYISVFTRKRFLVEDPSAIRALTLAADYDDGAVVYLNGQEVLRLNMPIGTVTRHTAAAGNHEASRGEGASPPNPKEFYALDPTLLIAGTNLIAVSGHNVSTNSSDFSLIVELYTNASMVRGPFVQMPDPGRTAAIVWHTAALTNGAVDYGLDLSYSAGTVSNATVGREHTIHLSGLAPGTTYFYRVRSGDETLAEGMSFRTRPEADQAFRFVVIGDHGQGTPGMYAIANLINARTDFDAVMTVGDNVYGMAPCNMDGAPGWYDPFWFTLYGPTMARVSTFPALGNHDWDTASGQYMVDYFRLPTNGPAGHIGKNYSYEFGNIHAVVIDTEPYEDNNTAAMSAINAWLAADLASATQRWRVAFLHRPPYTSVGSHNDNVRVKSNIVPILEAHGVQLVFQGHNHWYERINPINGIHYFTIAGSGAGLYTSSLRKDYSARFVNDRHSYAIVEVAGGSMRIEAVDDAGAAFDVFEIDLDHPFAMDGLLDDASWIRASNGLNVYAAIHGPFLYLATQDAGEGSDHFVYVADMLSTQRAANWAKSGTVMQWGAFLADENDGAFHGWFGPNEEPLTNFAFYKSVTSGLNNNGTNGNGVLEGSIHLAGHFGAFPDRLYLAAAPYQTTNGGHLISASQTPAGNGNGHIESNEFLLVFTRDIAMDLPAPLATTNPPIEAGMLAPLDGSASYSPSDLPLTFAWSYVGGPAGLFENAASPAAGFWLTQNVAGVETTLLALTIYDGRFSETAFVQQVFFPMADSDGDGLSDQEELTGLDNRLTAPNPNGHITDPLISDTDGDGVPDGQEAIAGTDPNDSASRFQLIVAVLQPPDSVVLQWSSESARLYDLWNTTNLMSPWNRIAANVAATPPINSYTSPATGSPSDFYAAEVKAP